MAMEFSAGSRIVFVVHSFDRTVCGEPLHGVPSITSDDIGETGNMHSRTNPYRCLNRCGTSRLEGQERPRTNRRESGENS